MKRRDFLLMFPAVGVNILASKEEETIWPNYSEQYKPIDCSYYYLTKHKGACFYLHAPHKLQDETVRKALKKSIEKYNSSGGVNEV
jgi:hypothetical protein